MRQQEEDEEKEKTDLGSILKEIKSNVDELYEFRDHFFENHDISEASNKSKIVSDKLEECLKKLDGLTEGIGVGMGTGGSGGAVGVGGVTVDARFKSNVFYQRGRALNVLPDHSPVAEKLLSKAVKLEPDFVEAWNELGECYWKRGDLENARTCFEGALEHRENKVSLRSLSIVLRQTGHGTEERTRNIENGLSRARKAVGLDTRDGISWSILGNAYLAHFFSVSQNPRTLRQAMSAYKQAEKDVIARSSSELHYNKAIALKYEEDFTGALESFSRACALEPTWDSPLNQKKSLLRSLTEIQTLIELKGRLKNKRFNALVDSVNPEKQLGPYVGGQYKSGGGAVVTLEEIPFKDLVEGLNTEKVVLGKVICSVRCEDSVPFTFCLVDRNAQCLAVNLYNLAPGKGVIIGDSVAIAEPYFTHIKVQHENQHLAFDLIRVESPLVLVINGKKASRDLQAGIELSTFTKSP